MFPNPLAHLDLPRLLRQVDERDSDPTLELHPYVSRGQFFQILIKNCLATHGEQNLFACFLFPPTAFSGEVTLYPPPQQKRQLGLSWLVVIEFYTYFLLDIYPVMTFSPDNTGIFAPRLLWHNSFGRTPYPVIPQHRTIY